MQSAFFYKRNAYLSLQASLRPQNSDPQGAGCHPTCYSPSLHLSSNLLRLAVNQTHLLTTLQYTGTSY